MPQNDPNDPNDPFAPNDPNRPDPFYPPNEPVRPNTPQSNFLFKIDLGDLALALFAQGLVFLSITILIDTMKMRSFKGTDNKQKRVIRTQLPENRDVLEHKEFANRTWNEVNQDHDYLIEC